uniref:Uncharacterized protein n=1 Tax=Oryza barthii TaxID=65489 RepID=A0A0D3F2Y9_9ORYZ
MDPGEKGSAARRRAREMQAAAARARSPGGASHRELDEVAGKWKQTNLGMALRPRAREEDVGGTVVRRGEIAAAVKEVMEGEKGHGVRRRARELQQAAGRVWSPEGSSRRPLEVVAGKWKAAAQK